MSFSPAVMKDGQISMKVVSYINVGAGFQSPDVHS